MNLEPLLNLTFPSYDELCKIADEVFESQRASEELREDHVLGDIEDQINQEVEEENEL